MRLSLLLGILAVPAAAQMSAPPPSTVADMREDLRLLTQNVGALTLRVEQLERQVAALQSGAGSSGNNQAYATVAQLNDAVAELNRTIRAAVASSQDETLRRVGLQMEKLANQTNAALDSLSRGPRPSRITPAETPAASEAPAPAPSSGRSFSTDYPKEGISYTVVRGDTLSKIAAKTGAKAEDIVNANKLSDPSRLRVGQVLFIPGAK